MASACEMMEMYDRGPYADLRQYVRQRVKEDPNTYPPVYPGIPYIDYLIGQMSSSKERSGRLHRIMPGITASIMDELRDKVDTFGADDNDHIALVNIGLVIPHLEPNSSTKGMSDNLKALAIKWMREDPKTVEGHTGLSMAQALSCLQGKGDPADFWQDIWADEQHPHLWTTGFVGIIRVSTEETFQALPAALQRAQESVWHADSAAWALYTYYLRKDPLYLLKFANTVREYASKISQDPLTLNFARRLIHQLAIGPKDQLERFRQSLL